MSQTEPEAETESAWTTQARTHEYINIKNRDGPADVSSDITSATKSVKSWLIEEGIGPSEWPDVTTLSEEGVNSLLGEAVARLAASEHHERKSRNVTTAGTRDPNAIDTPDYVFMERRARGKFEDWLVRWNYDDEDAEGGVEVQHLSRYSGARSSSLMDVPQRGPNHRRRL